MPIKDEMANIQPAPAGCQQIRQDLAHGEQNLDNGRRRSNPRLQTLTSVLEDGTTQSQVKFQYVRCIWPGHRSDGSINLGTNGPGPLLKEVVTTYAAPGNGTVNRPSRITVKDGRETPFLRID